MTAWENPPFWSAVTKLSGHGPCHRWTVSPGLYPAPASTTEELEPTETWTGLALKPPTRKPAAALKPERVPLTTMLYRPTGAVALSWPDKLKFPVVSVFAACSAENNPAGCEVTVTGSFSAKPIPVTNTNPVSPAVTWLVLSAIEAR